ncbi:MAG: cytochrome-c oxidase, cbb3-type subunit III, partial [Burkholderiaceae bacterium]
GSHQGQLGWTQNSQYEKEVADVSAAIAPIYDKYLKMPIADVAKEPEAVAIGERLYQTYCVQCHGSDARGSRGFPNLTDSDWLGKGGPDYILETMMNGRQAVMPPMGAALGSDKEVTYVANYVLSLSNSTHDSFKAQMGRDSFGVCAACHGSDGKGNPVVGAPNLTDDIWLYGGGISAIKQAITRGLNNQMPAFGHLLQDGKGHILAAYIWSLSQPKSAVGSATN